MYLYHNDGNNKLLFRWNNLYRNDSYKFWRYNCWKYKKKSTYKFGKKAFQIARNAKALLKNTEYRTGYVQTPNSVSRWFEYNGKKFLGNQQLIDIFYGKKNILKE